uniref:Sperm protamine P1 n=1 Tax=Sus scrofa TaxID=9823 RepID=A0A4X1T7M3_PIG
MARYRCCRSHSRSRCRPEDEDVADEGGDVVRAVCCRRYTPSRPSRRILNMPPFQ